MRILLAVAIVSAATARADLSANRWFLRSCDGGLCPLTWQVADAIENDGGTIINGGVPLSDFEAAVRSAFATWEAADACVIPWSAESRGTFEMRGRSSLINPQDRNNRFGWIVDWPNATTALALTTTTFLTSSHELIDADLEMNDTVPWSTTGASDAYDVATITLHEVGHVLGLDHTADPTSVMTPLRNPGSIALTLSPRDSEEICTQYHPVAIACASCASVECADGLTCLEGRCFEHYVVDCAAKLFLPDGGALCACGDQVRTRGETCGPSSPCDHATSCVDGSCRTPCSLAVPTCAEAEGCAEGQWCLPSNLLRAVGEPCTHDCTFSASCHDGVCRAQCDPDRDACEVGHQCDLEARVCLPLHTPTGCATDAGLPMLALALALWGRRHAMRSA